MQPIARIHMHRGIFYDTVPLHGLKGLLQSLERTHKEGQFFYVQTIYGQQVFINPAYVHTVSDLTAEPKLLASAWDRAERLKED